MVLTALPTVCLTLQAAWTQLQGPPCAVGGHSRSTDACQAGTPSLLLNRADHKQAAPSTAVTTAGSVHFQAHHLPAASAFVISCRNNQLLVSAGGS